MPDELSLRPFTQLAPLIERRQISPVELFDETLKRIHKLQPKLSSFITITEVEGRKDAVGTVEVRCMASQSQSRICLPLAECARRRVPKSWATRFPTSTRLPLF